MQTRLILIRHGETDYNLHSRYCGFSDPPLNEKGILQARKLADKLKDYKIDKVYSSDLKRAYETAEIIFENKIIERSSDLREMNFGIFEGLKYEEIINKYQVLYAEWIKNPKMVKIPEGEELEEVKNRIVKCLSNIIQKHTGSTIAVVTHYGSIRVFLCDIFKYDLNQFWQIKQGNGAVNIIDYDEGAMPVLVRINDISHLDN